MWNPKTVCHSPEGCGAGHEYHNLEFNIYLLLDSFGAQFVNCTNIKAYLLGFDKYVHLRIPNPDQGRNITSTPESSPCHFPFTKAPSGPCLNKGNHSSDFFPPYIICLI